MEFTKIVLFLFVVNKNLLTWKLRVCIVLVSLSYNDVKDYDKNSSDQRLDLQNLKLNYRLVIGNFDINFISNKFDNLKLIIQGKIDKLVITKTDSTFPLNQFAIRGYSNPYRFDRNRNGGGAFIYV